jgi:hypothetical protein
MNVVLPHVRRNVLPDGFLRAPELGRVCVVTEAGHVQRYGTGVEVRIVASVLDVEQVRRAVMDLLRTGPLERVLAPFELSVPVAGFLRSYFGLPGMDFETANRFTNKYLMKRALAAAGLPVTPFRVAYGLAEIGPRAEELGWPVVIKPVLGGGTLDVVVLDGAAALERFAASPDAARVAGLGIPLIVERYVEIEAEYTCNGIVHEGEVVFAAVLKYPVPMLGCPAGLNASYTLPPGHPDLAGIVRLHAQTVRALGLHDGVTHMEILKSGAGLLAGEIACRPPGGGIPGGIRLHYGVDLWRAFRDTSLGRAPDVRAREGDGLLMNYLLPLKRGRIVRLSDPADLAAVPSVIRVDMYQKVGGGWRDRVGASAAAGVVHLAVRDELEAWDRMRQLAERYVIEVDEEDPCCTPTA